MELLRERREDAEHLRAFHAMNETYFAAFERGETEAVATMIDFYGGAGTYASWPQRVRAYAAETAAVNILDWKTAYAFPLTAGLAGRHATADPGALGRRQPSRRAARKCTARPLHSAAPATGTVEGAAHFMVATHAAEVARVVGSHIDGIAG